MMCAFKLAVAENERERVDDGAMQDDDDDDAAADEEEVKDKCIGVTKEVGK